MAFLIVLGVSTILISNHISNTKVIDTIEPGASQISEAPTLNTTLVEETPITMDAPTTEVKDVEPTPKISQKKTNPTSKPSAQVAGVKTDSCEGALITKFTCLLNEYRKSRNLGKVTHNSSLAMVAYNHSNWMNATKTLSHVDANGFRHNDRCAQAGIVCRAENLAEGYLDANILLTQWQKSGGHNINLLGPYSTIGLGVSGKYVTLIFN